jgi:hypothetical protein
MDPADIEVFINPYLDELKLNGRDWWSEYASMLLKTIFIIWVRLALAVF